MVFHCGLKQPEIIYRKSCVIAVPDDGYAGIFHGVDISLCIFFLCARFYDWLMHAGDHIVEVREHTVIQIQMSLPVDDIGFCPVKNAHTQTLLLRVCEIAEIGDPASAQCSGTVVGYAQHFQVPGCRCLCHIRDSGCGTVPAGDGMCVDVEFIPLRRRGRNFCCMAAVKDDVRMRMYCHKTKPLFPGALWYEDSKMYADLLHCV